MQTCTEIEKMLKHLCGIPLKDRREITEYRNFFSQNHAAFFDIEIGMLFYSGRNKIQPWISWKKEGSPDFWRAYNKTKHQGELTEAKLQYAIESLGALYALLLASSKKEQGMHFSNQKLVSIPKMFSYEGMTVVQASSYKKALIIPGF